MNKDYILEVLAWDIDADAKLEIVEILAELLPSTNKSKIQEILEAAPKQVPAPDVQPNPRQFRPYVSPPDTWRKDGDPVRYPVEPKQVPIYYTANTKDIQSIVESLGRSFKSN